MICNYIGVTKKVTYILKVFSEMTSVNIKDHTKCLT